MTDLEAALEASGQQRVKVAVCDLDGILRGKYIHRDKCMQALEKGFGFCSVVLGWDLNDQCYENSYTGWHNGYPDARVLLHPDTMRVVPWDGGIPLILGSFFEDGSDTPLPLCPRGLLQRVCQRAEDLGYQAVFGSEFEWFNFQETPQSLDQKGFQDLEHLSPGMCGYSLLRLHGRKDFCQALFEGLAEIGVELEGLHTETGPGIYEAALAPQPALRAADNSVLFKQGVKELAHEAGIVPCFMARWHRALPGASGHLHQSLVSKKGGENVFRELNAVTKQYMAGLLLASQEMLPLFAPTVNSYKRLVPGFWAPTHAHWGIENRTCALRYIPGSRVEFRVPGADINPYLAIAACLGAGVYGIEHKLELEEAVVGNAYTSKDHPPLQRDLKSAVEVFENSQMAREVLGKEFVEHFAQSRLWEWEESQKEVSHWELKRYMELV